jgi:hypothetical protein
MMQGGYGGGGQMGGMGNPMQMFQGGMQHHGQGNM